MAFKRPLKTLKEAPGGSFKTILNTLNPTKTLLKEVLELLLYIPEMLLEVLDLSWRLSKAPQAVVDSYWFRNEFNF